MELHLSLKKAREEAHRTATQVAEYLGVTEDMIRRYESGRSEISLRQAGRYAEYLGKQLGDVLPSTQIRGTELLPLVAALQNFDREEQIEFIAKAARDVAFTSAVVNGRILRQTGGEILTSGTTPHENKKHLTLEFNGPPQPSGKS